ncbi:hypothetical protein GA0070216_1353 [Micromonospora matsumotoense]|uniref:Uncharacterized protein n=1 Tax=Micromonospora matsumotoense TaxID=121616 RepID=A0A1C5AWC3_9ACTN|nr:hypothetical protein GA0070216_1353 [Micromonospora matsumotoense]
MHTSRATTDGSSVSIRKTLYVSFLRGAATALGGGLVSLLTWWLQNR